MNRVSRSIGGSVGEKVNPWSPAGGEQGSFQVEPGHCGVTTAQCQHSYILTDSWLVEHDTDSSIGTGFQFLEFQILQRQVLVPVLDRHQDLDIGSRFPLQHILSVDQYFTSSCFDDDVDVCSDDQRCGLVLLGSHHHCPGPGPFDREVDLLMAGFVTSEIVHLDFNCFPWIDQVEVELFHIISGVVLAKV